GKAHALSLDPQSIVVRSGPRARRPSPHPPNHRCHHPPRHTHSPADLPRPMPLRRHPPDPLRHHPAHHHPPPPPPPPPPTPPPPPSSSRRSASLLAAPLDASTWSSRATEGNAPSSSTYAEFHAARTIATFPASHCAANGSALTDFSPLARSARTLCPAS